MPEPVLRIVLIICCVFALGATANIAFMQDDGQRLSNITTSRYGTSSTEASNTEGSAGYTALRAPNPRSRAGSDTRSGARSGTRPRSGTRQGQASKHKKRDLVRAIQRELKSAGYMRRQPDGNLDMPTRAAILAYERRTGQEMTGAASEHLFKTLLLGITVGTRPPRKQQTQSATRIIRYIQQLLDQRSPGTLNTNGRIDEAMRHAIMAFERSHGMRVEGKITAELVTRLQHAGQRG